MNFLCFRVNRVNIQGLFTNKARKKSVHTKEEGMEEFAIFVFDAYYINVYVKFDDFCLTGRERKSISMC